MEKRVLKFLLVCLLLSLILNIFLICQNQGLETQIETLRDNYFLSPFKTAIYEEFFDGYDDYEPSQLNGFI